MHVRYESAFVRCGVASCWDAVVSTCFVNDVRTERANKRMNKRRNAATEARANERTHATKIEPKSPLGRPWNEPGEPKIDEKSRKIAFGAILGRSWRALGRCWRDLGRCWRALGRCWRALGRSWQALGRSWRALGTSRALLGRLGERSGRVFRTTLTKKLAGRLANRFLFDFVSLASCRATALICTKHQF